MTRGCVWEQFSTKLLLHGWNFTVCVHTSRLLGDPSISTCIDVWLVVLNCPLLWAKRVVQIADE